MKRLGKSEVERREREERKPKEGTIKNRSADSVELFSAEGAIFLKYDFLSLSLLAESTGSSLRKQNERKKEKKEPKAHIERRR